VIGGLEFLEYFLMALLTTFGADKCGARNLRRRYQGARKRAARNGDDGERRHDQRHNGATAMVPDPETDLDKTRSLRIGFHWILQG